MPIPAMAVAVSYRPPTRAILVALAFLVRWHWVVMIGSVRYWPAVTIVAVGSKTRLGAWLIAAAPVTAHHRIGLCAIHGLPVVSAIDSSFEASNCFERSLPAVSGRVRFVWVGNWISQAILVLHRAQWRRCLRHHGSDSSCKYLVSEEPDKSTGDSDMPSGGCPSQRAARKRLARGLNGG
jgi:hypothetical protein